MMKNTSCLAFSVRRLGLALAVLVLWPAISNAADWDIDQLMRELAQSRSGHARFVEKKSIAMLDKPVESYGELFFRAPDHLEKRTLKPKPETMILDGGEMVVERGRQKHTLQMQNYPELAVFIDSIRSTLAGDRQALERNYQLRLDGARQNWTLQLIPIEQKMLAVVKRIRIAGSQNLVSRIEITQADGDSSVMSIEKLDTP